MHGKGLFVVLGMTAMLLAASTVGATGHPNIVLILADDLGIGDVGAYNDASKVPTPNLDRLAAEGIRLTDAHSPSAVCTPTRYGLLTGRYSWRSRLKSGVLMGYDPPLIEPDRVTVASFLKEHGYATACVGKWHLGLGWAARPGGERPRRNDPGDVDYATPFTGGPVALGFDRFFGIPASLDMAPYCWLDQDRVTEIPAGHINASGGAAYWRAGAIAPDFTHEGTLPRIALEATRFIDDAAAGDEPFLLYVPLTAPHTPHLPIGRFQGASEAGVYGDFVHQVDFAIGLIRRSLLNNEVLDDTLFIVTSDNGAHWPPGKIEKFGHRANGPWRGQKADIWEGGHRVPFLARWPERIAAGSTSDQRVCLTDVLATVADLIGEPVPDGAGEDSMSMLHALVGETPRGPVRDVTVHHSINGTFAIRSGDWKLIQGLGSNGFSHPRKVAPEPDGPRGQLYDLARDPAETTNLWLERPEVVERLTAELDRERNRPAPRAARRPPNVLVLLSDDQRYDTIAALGNDAIVTPNLDRLARRGTAFTNAYILGAHHGAVCCPSRAMLLTGRHFYELPLNTTKVWVAAKDEQGACPHPTFPELLRGRGYETFGTGKWHNGRRLFARGFADGGEIMFGGMSDHLKVPVYQFDPSGTYAGDPEHAETFSSELFSDAAIDFLERRDRDKPFLLYVSYTAPHDPRTAPEKYASMYDPASITVPPNFMDEHPFPIGDLRVRDENLAPFPRTPRIAQEHIAGYYAMITHLDAQIGRVLDTLEATGAADDTIVIFAGDNGLAVGQHGLLGKQNVYEHSARVPMIIAGPGIPRDRRHDAFVYVHDLCPTICELTGTPVPPSVQSRSLQPLLTGAADTIRDSIFVSYTTDIGQRHAGEQVGRGSMRAVRKGRWKLIRTTFAGHDETLLFDLEADPWETRDLSDDPAHASRIAELTGLMERWLSETGDPARLDRANFGIRVGPA